jgi:hypothetical protein
MGRLILFLTMVVSAWCSAWGFPWNLPLVVMAAGLFGWFIPSKQGTSA